MIKKEETKEMNKCLVEVNGNASNPPARALLNRMLKENTLDRKLVDSVIYAGSYGINIQKGFAEALCTSLSSANPTQVKGSCDWSSIREDKTTRYIFITHSLGSRILFDTLLGLYGVKIRPGAPIFEYKDNVNGAIKNIIGQTSVIYMMANQLSLLGMANIPLTFNSNDEPKPMLIKPLESLKVRNESPDDGPPVIIGKIPESEKPTAKQIVDNYEEGPKLGNCPINPLIGVATIKSSDSGDKDKRPNLDIVAFNDTNDLLTWSVPQWYESLPECAPNLRIVNAFVKNAQPWLVFASPAKAHDGYFENSEVWNLMRCGAEEGKLAPCSSP